MTTRELPRQIVLSAAIGALVGVAVSTDARRGLLQGALSGVLVLLFGWLADSTDWRRVRTRR